MGCAAVVAGTGCGGSETSSRLRIDEDAGTTRLESEWHYDSFEVDVDLELATEDGGDACSTTAVLDVNDVVSAADRYLLAPTGCDVLRLTADGDIVLFDSETGLDWSREALRVDTDNEVISLGPVTTTSGAGGAGAAGAAGSVTYRFALSAPPCPEQPSCDCGKLERSGGEETLALPLGKNCD